MSGQRSPEEAADPKATAPIRALRWFLSNGNGIIALGLAVFVLTLPWASGVRVTRVVSLGVALLMAGFLIGRGRISVRHLLPWLPAVGAVLGAILISSVYSMDPAFSFKTLTRQHLWYFLTFLLVGAWATTPWRQFFLLRMLVISAGISAGAGIVLYIFAESWEADGLILRAHRYVYTAMDTEGNVYYRAQGTLMSYTRSAMLFMVTIPATMYLLARAVRRRAAAEVALAAAVALLSIVYLFLTKSRGAWVGAGLGGALALLLAGARMKHAAIIIGAVLLLGIMAPPVRDRAATFVSHLSDPGLLLSGRLDLWSQGIRPIRENPWVGVGYGADIFLQEKVMEDYELFTDRRQPDLHQLYLQTVAEVGILGSLAYGWFVFLLAIRGLRSLRAAGIPPDDEPGLAVALPVFAAFMVVGTIYYFNEEEVAHTLFTTLGLVAAAKAGGAGEGAAAPPPSPSD